MFGIDFMDPRQIIKFVKFSHGFDDTALKETGDFDITFMTAASRMAGLRVLTRHEVYRALLCRKLSKFACN